MKTECVKEVCEKFKPALRGWGKTNATTSMFLLNLYGCMETDEERIKFREMIEDIYGGIYGETND